MKLPSTMSLEISESIMSKLCRRPDVAIIFLRLSDVSWYTLSYHREDFLSMKCCKLNEGTAILVRGRSLHRSQLLHLGMIKSSHQYPIPTTRKALICLRLRKPIANKHKPHNENVCHSAKGIADTSTKPCPARFAGRLIDLLRAAHLFTLKPSILWISGDTASCIM